jgi:hypothetical protein
MPSKLCSTCSVEKPVSEFYKQTTRGTHGVRGSCKACDNLKKRRYRTQLGETLKIRKQQEYLKNRESRLAQKKEYRQSNRGKINALVAARKKVIKQRTPKWVTKEELWLIKEAYELAALRTKMFNFSWHVDHVLPLQGETVSGLHVPNNLQVIPWLDNIQKKNKVLHAE